MIHLSVYCVLSFFSFLEITKLNDDVLWIWHHLVTSQGLRTTLSQWATSCVKRVRRTYHGTCFPSIRRRISPTPARMHRMMEAVCVFPFFRERGYVCLEKIFPKKGDIFVLKDDDQFPKYPILSTLTVVFVCSTYLAWNQVMVHISSTPN